MYKLRVLFLYGYGKTWSNEYRYSSLVELLLPVVNELNQSIGRKDRKLIFRKDNDNKNCIFIIKYHKTSELYDI